jgi:hypothetical protein
VFQRHYGHGQKDNFDHDHLESPNVSRSSSRPNSPLPPISGLTGIVAGIRMCAHDQWITLMYNIKASICREHGAGGNTNGIEHWSLRASF